MLLSIMKICPPLLSIILFLSALILMGDWCGIVLEYLQPVKKEITAAKEVSCRIGMVKK